MIKSGQSHDSDPSPRIFYGWWIVVAAFLNLFFAVGIIFYGFPVFYRAFVASLGFTRAQVTQGFLLGFLVVGLPFGLLAGALIDRVGARWVILSGVGFIGIPLILMGSMTKFWQYESLCIAEVLGYTLAGPIANQVLVSRWFRVRRGRAMGYAYLGLGLGGVIAPPLANSFIRNFGWRHALEIIGALILIVLFPVGLWITRSDPAEMGLAPDGVLPVRSENGDVKWNLHSAEFGCGANRQLLAHLVGATLVIGAINAVIQHFILAMKDAGYSGTTAARFLSILLASTLGGRVLVGYFADRFKKKNTMALFYLLFGGAIPLFCIAHRPVAVLAFVIVFGFAIGADYMLIPLVTAECFGVGSLGKLLALIIMGYSIGQWLAPWIAGRIFDTHHSYSLAWTILSVASLLGAAAIYAISVPSATERGNVNQR